MNDKNDLNKGRIWNISLTAISIINILILSLYFTINYNKLDNFQIKLTILVGIYTFVCAIRSIWPRIDNTRLCFYKNIISLPIVGRALATIAELSFILLIVLINKKILVNFNIFSNKRFNIKSLLTINGILFPIIVFAQICCWIGVITTDHLWNAVEESMWAGFGILSIVLYIILFVFICKVGKLNGQTKLVKILIPFMILILIGYVVFMIMVDVPMYLKNSNKHDGNYMGLKNGIIDLCKCKKVTSSFKEWKEDIPWLTGYFTLAVWASIGLLIWYGKYKNLSA